MRWLAGLALVAAVPAAADHAFLGRDIAAGAGLYQHHCAACHGANLEGQPNWRSPNAQGVLPAPPHDVSGHTWHHSDTQLFDYTALGGRGALAALGMTDINSGMPAFENTLTEDEIWTILAYIRSTWPAHAQAAQASRTPAHE